MKTFIHEKELSQTYTDFVASLCEVAQSHFAKGKSSDARHMLQAALPLAEMLQAEAAQLALSLAEGKMLATEYIYTNADADYMLNLLHNAQKLAEQANDSKRLAETFHWLGIAHYFVELNASAKVNGGEGSYQEAFAYHQKALELREKWDDTRGICESLFQIGTVYERWQQVDQAQEYYSIAYRMADRAGFTCEKVEPMRHFAFHALSQGNLDKALHDAKQALALREQMGFKPYLPLDHQLISEILLQMGKLDEAETHARKACTMANEMGYTRTVASALIILGDIFAERQKADQAKEQYKAALVLAQRLQIPLLLSKVNERLERIG